MRTGLQLYFSNIYNVAFHHLNRLTTLFLDKSNTFCFKSTFMYHGPITICITLMVANATDCI